MSSQALTQSSKASCTGQKSSLPRHTRRSASSLTWSAQLHRAHLLRSSEIVSASVTLARAEA